MSKLKQVIFLPYVDAIKLIPRQGTALISILDPGTKDPEFDAAWTNILRMKFHDIDMTTQTAILNSWVLFDELMADKIIDFLSEVERTCHTIVVHCHAGASRSGAVAKFIAELYDLPFNRTYASYNKFVYQTLRDEYVHRCMVE